MEAYPAGTVSIEARRATARTAFGAALLTAVLAFVGLAYRAHTVISVPNPDGSSYAPAFRDERRGPGAMLNAHDGQAFGSLALDPLLAHPDRWGGGRTEMGYRAARPLLGWAVMLTSFGSTRAAAWSLLVWTAIGIGLTAAAAVVLAARWGRRGDWVPLVLLLPGVAIQLLYGGLCDGLATGLVLFGVAWWLEGRDWWAVLALCLAALTRETTLLVTLALLLASDRKRAVRLVAPFAVYAGWLGVVWLRLRVFPGAARPGAFGLPPGNLREAVRSWGLEEVVAAVVVVALASVAWRRAPSAEVRWLAGLSALMAVTLGPVMLRSWDFGRPLLPVTVVGLCLLGRAAGRRPENRASDSDLVPALDAVPG